MYICIIYRFLYVMFYYYLWQVGKVRFDEKTKIYLKQKLNRSWIPMIVRGSMQLHCRKSESGVLGQAVNLLSLSHFSQRKV